MDLDLGIDIDVRRLKRLCAKRRGPMVFPCSFQSIQAAVRNMGDEYDTHIEDNVAYVRRRTDAEIKAIRKAKKW